MDSQEDCSAAQEILAGQTSTLNVRTDSQAKSGHRQKQGKIASSVVALVAMRSGLAGQPELNLEGWRERRIVAVPCPFLLAGWLWTKNSSQQ
jgi:hypothetical protein